ncbi:DNA adenine methylase [Flavobacterium cucumis]|uniref:site-specific DNA-methyltransferase (adenine-specific) n=1 Tax=Flavobacterium cucumis TaxID=416016 RepID=A0A1M7ZVG5_9FLAO|nr:DNA adenine methylase [Flavobacterium cucumis]SHO72862.1 DNA adenine methylase [Flavobacterium cucumis]
MFYSPLRYPGGKNRLAAFVAKICSDNRINGHYVEPYAGGASVALFLLFEGYVDKITINDKDRSIYAFWHSILNNSRALCKLIDETELNIENWRIQKEIQKNKETATLLELGFSTLFLNRTNRSGIINAGVIGGINQQGNYKMDCRFNKEDIKAKIKLIAKHRKKIRLFNFDAIQLIDRVEREAIDNNIIFYFDPPYYLKADSLYLNHYIGSDHLEVAERIARIQNIQWIVSYDNHEAIRNLYNEFPKKEYTFNHSAYNSRVGQEILFFSPQLTQPNLDETYNPVNFKLVKSANNKEIIYQ